MRIKIQFCTVLTLLLASWAFAENMNSQEEARRLAAALGLEPPTKMSVLENKSKVPEINDDPAAAVKRLAAKLGLGEINPTNPPNWRPKDKKKMEDASASDKFFENQNAGGGGGGGGVGGGGGAGGNAQIFGNGMNRIQIILNGLPVLKY